MILLWLFWLEVLSFSLYALWRLSVSAEADPLTGYQWADLFIYGLVFLYGLYGFVSFLRRRLTARSAGVETR